MSEDTPAYQGPDISHMDNLVSVRILHGFTQPEEALCDICAQTIPANSPASMVQLDTNVRLTTFTGHRGCMEYLYNTLS